MPNNEERIVFLITKPKGKCLGQIDKDYCQETCWVKGKCPLGITRAEAVKVMKLAVKAALNKAMAWNRSWEDTAQGAAEAALDALLGVKNA